LDFGIWFFWGNFWRRGVHVNTPKLGSRGAGKCLGEFRGVYADLRREYVWGNLKLDFFDVLGGGPRGATEEGGPMCAICCAFRGALL
jgi:hypothetical protein